MGTTDSCIKCKENVVSPNFLETDEDEPKYICFNCFIDMNPKQKPGSGKIIKKCSSCEKYYLEERKSCICKNYK